MFKGLIVKVTYKIKQKLKKIFANPKKKIESFEESGIYLRNSNEFNETMAKGYQNT